MSQIEHGKSGRDYLAELEQMKRRSDRALVLSLVGSAVLGVGGVIALNLIFG